VPTSLATGSHVGSYRIQREIGEGGTAAVYQAVHPVHGDVALKVLKERLRGDRTAIARFIREANYGARISHPNVVRTIEIGQSGDGLHFMALEWAGGEILERYAKQHAPLPWDEVAAIIRQIADAVHAAHAVNIVHRDLKPENIMYDPTGRIVKLLDFGIATDTQLSPDERLTRAGFFVGTLMYIAPEALTGELVGPAADQYSLATIAYYLLTGTLPYTAKAPREMFAQLLAVPPIPLNEAKSDYRFPVALEQAVMRGLARNPSDRFSSTTEFATALEQVLYTPFEQKPTGLFHRLRAVLRKGQGP
jgi:eukaryotic-like serine/threonine-protein kinase